MNKSPKSTDVLLVLDVDDASVDSHNDIIYWNSYTQSKLDRVFSIPQMVEENANYLKAKYLELIYEFGEIEVDGKSIIEHLKIRKNFSYWWMTLLVEKCNIVKSPQIDNIIKLTALEQWLQENKYQKIRLTTANKELATAVFLLTKKLSICFEWEKNQNNKINSNSTLLKKAFRTLPNIIKAPVWLLHYLLSNWALKGVGLKEWKKTTATTTFVSYFFYLIPESAKQGQYQSHYWTTLVDLLGGNQHHTNWLHIYMKDDLLPTARKARNLIQQFNRENKGDQVHVTLSSFLTLRLVFSTLKDWYKILKLNKLVWKHLKVESDYLWPLFKKDCQDSMSGMPAINSLLYFNLFERAMYEMPVQKKGCYLQENQSWEFGFITAWQSAGHSQNLVGFPHSTVRYWDLRYFFDPRNYSRKGQINLPLPSFVGVSGSVIKNMYVDSGYPQDMLIELEALRYLHLCNNTIHKVKACNEPSKGKVVLVTGEYTKLNTDKLLNTLLSALVDINQSTSYIVKSHPAYPVNMENFTGLHGKSSIKPIAELLTMCDIVYSGSSTSAAVEAYCAGLPVVVLLDGTSLNMSSLRGYKGVYFVRNFKDLASVINSVEVTSLKEVKGYFYLDLKLPKWREWLNSGVKDK